MTVCLTVVGSCCACAQTKPIDAPRVLRQTAGARAFVILTFSHWSEAFARPLSVSLMTAQGRITYRLMRLSMTRHLRHSHRNTRHYLMLVTLAYSPGPLQAAGFALADGMARRY